jgi:hypothetical protein
MRLGTLVGFATATLVLYGNQSHACQGVRSKGHFATAARGGEQLTVSIELQNSGPEACKMFAKDDINALDNSGNSWNMIDSTYLTGVYVCTRTQLCLTGDRQDTESGATVIRPGETARLTIPFRFRKARSSTVGDLLDVSIILMTQPVSQQGAPLGQWGSMSLGPKAIPLKAVQ